MRDRAGRETAASGESSVEARNGTRAVDAPPKTKAATVIGSYRSGNSLDDDHHDHRDNKAIIVIYKNRDKHAWLITWE